MGIWNKGDGGTGADVEAIKIRFFAKVTKTSGCWFWNAGKTTAGYGAFRIGRAPGVHMLAHRFSYEIHKGPIPDNLHVCHHCDTPACVNPAHLFLGTHSENLKDMWAKNRCHPPGTKGERHHRAKLSNADVLLIRQQYVRISYGKSNARELAARFNVTHTTIKQILSRSTWPHL